MIKHTVYSDRVEATYSEGDSWYETIASRRSNKLSKLLRKVDNNA